MIWKSGIAERGVSVARMLQKEYIYAKLNENVLPRLANVSNTEGDRQ